MMVVERERLELELDLPGLELRPVEDLVEQHEQVRRSPADDVDARALRRRDRVDAGHHEQLGEAEDRVERTAQVVRPSRRGSSRAAARLLRLRACALREICLELVHARAQPQEPREQRLGLRGARRVRLRRARVPLSDHALHRQQIGAQRREHGIGREPPYRTAPRTTAARARRERRLRGERHRRKHRAV